MVRRYAAGTAAGAALMVSLTGCLGDSGNGRTDAVNVSAAQAIGLASKKTSTVGSYKVDMTADGTGGTASKAHGVVQVRLRPSLAAIGTLDAASAHGMSLPGGQRAILLDGVMYVKVPSQFSQFTQGRPWVRFSVSKAAGQAGFSMDDLLKQADPAQQTKAFTGSKDVRKVGTQSIDGVRTTHYRGSVTPEEAAAQLGGKARQQAEEHYRHAGTTKVVFDLWVGQDDLPRKLVTRSTASHDSMTCTMIYSGYGKPVDVTAPPANQVADGDNLKQNLGRGAAPNIPG